jgi:hypothetical protein
MQQATRVTIVQSGLPVHQRCALAPDGYPGILRSFPKGLVLNQCISGELFSYKSGEITVHYTITMPWPTSGTSLILSRTTHIDTLATCERNASYRDHMFYGD